MCRDTTQHAFLRALPKCEHHLHIEGTLEPALLFELAHKNEVILPSNDGAFASPEALRDRYNCFTSLDDFLSYYYIGMSVLRTASDFEALAWAYFSKVASQGLKHAEIFFDPQAHLSRDIDYKTVINGLRSASLRAEEELGLTSLLIACFLRHLPAADCLAVFCHPDVQASIQAKQIVGIGLDSSELPFPPGLFRDLYAEAQSAGLRKTAHAGEEGPVGYIAEALDSLDIERIDHGLRLPDDEDLMQKVAQDKTLLSLCPVSNVLLRCVTQLSEVPVRRLLEAGVRFSINSDDPAYFGGNYILENYCAVQEHFDLSIDEWNVICRGAIEGSWCSEDRKGALLSDLKEVIEQYRCKGVRGP